MSHPVSVSEVATRRDHDTFIRLPWRLYRGDPNWVPPLLSEMWSITTPKGSPQFAAGPHALALARRGGEVVGRIGVGINETLNRKKGLTEGYLTLFEAVDDYEVARSLFDWAEAWLRARGATAVKGPVSPTNGDDYRGLLVMGFDGPPCLMDSYNPPYYAEFFDRWGFEKYIDLFAYLYQADQDFSRYERVAAYAMERGGFHVDPLNLKHLERDLVDIKHIIDLAMPEEWPDLTPPPMEEIREMGRKLAPLAVPELCCIARSNAGEPLGFVIGLPDYNQVLRHLNGRLFPTGFLKFLWYRRKIQGVRLFIGFVVPHWRKKGVTGAMFLHLISSARRLGYKWGEGSTIGETNLPMRRDAERAGGRHYRTYRIYSKAL